MRAIYFVYNLLVSICYLFFVMIDHFLFHCHLFVFFVICHLLFVIYYGLFCYHLLGILYLLFFCIVLYLFFFCFCFVFIKIWVFSQPNWVFWGCIQYVVWVLWVEFSCCWNELFFQNDLLLDIWFFFKYLLLLSSICCFSSTFVFVFTFVIILFSFF